ncbi:MAG: tyrosine-type recombinase/integrase [Chloroflexi bacterium]|nr:tyrosine-type recombinase/integrase [Chloroflexota bacterium]
MVAVSFSDRVAPLRAFVEAGLILDPWLAGLGEDYFAFGSQELLYQFNHFADWDTQAAKIAPAAGDYRRAFTAFTGIGPGMHVLEAVVSLAYWAGLRISEIAALRSADCDLNQRAGALRLVDAKGGKTRTIDLHNQARRALLAYLHAPAGTSDSRDPESGYVFTSQRAAWLRQQGRPDHLSMRGIEHLWRGLTAQATHEEWAALQGAL